MRWQYVGNDWQYVGNMVAICWQYVVPWWAQCLVAQCLAYGGKQIGNMVAWRRVGLATWWQRGWQGISKGLGLCWLAVGSQPKAARMG